MGVNGIELNDDEQNRFEAWQLSPFLQSEGKNS